MTSKFQKYTNYQLNNLMHNILKCDNMYHLEFKDEYNIDWYSKESGNLVVTTEKQDYGKQLADYCSNWSAIMPIAVEHGFSIELPDDNLGGVGTITKYVEGDTDVYVDYTVSSGTQRAIVICFLEMMEKQQ